MVFKWVNVSNAPNERQRESEGITCGVSPVNVFTREKQSYAPLGFNVKLKSNKYFLTSLLKPYRGTGNTRETKGQWHTSAHAFQA